VILEAYGSAPATGRDEEIDAFQSCSGACVLGPEEEPADHGLRRALSRLLPG
jgi:hypothetical protein